MSNLTKSYKSNFTTVPNNIINDKSISLKAKGVYLFLISKPDNWHFSVDRISTQNSDGLASVKSALKELEDKRFLKRVQINKRGVFGENDYIIFDEPYPLDENRPTVPLVEKPLAGKPSAGNRPTLVKTDLVKGIKSKDINTPLPLEVQFLLSSDGGGHLKKYLSFRSKNHGIKNPVAFSRSVEKSLRACNQSEISNYLAFNYFTSTDTGKRYITSVVNYLVPFTLGFHLPYSEYLELFFNWSKEISNDINELPHTGTMLLDLALFDMSCIYSDFKGVKNV